VKDAGLADEPEPIPVGPMTSEWRTAVDRPEVHDVYRAWRRLADSYDGDRMFVGEVFFTDPARIAPYVRADELQLAFNFPLVFQDWDADGIRRVIDESLARLPIVTWVLESHDVARIVTRFGAREARAAALLLLALPGPVFLYEGQELGLEEVDLPDELRQDPMFTRSGGEWKGRDGCRVPIPWERELPASTWLPQPAAWSALSVEAQREDADSMLSLYRLALRRRPSGGFRWRDSEHGVLAFDRGDVTCVVNFGPATVDLPPGRVEIASDAADTSLPPNTAAWIR
jgi:alpha-glucosidase